MAWVVYGLAIVGLALLIGEATGLARSPHRNVRVGAASELIETHGCLEVPTSVWAPDQVSPSTTTEVEPTTAHTTEDRSTGSDMATGLVAVGLSLGASAADYLHVDQSVLDAYSQLSQEEITNVFQLNRLIEDREYKVDTTGFEIKLRGHVGEQDVYDQMSNWNADGLSVPVQSNNAADDGVLDGHAFNVKVGADSSALSEHIRDHPDIPVIVNADMAGLPEDAIHVDLSQPFDTDLLADHGAIVADGLLLSDIQDALADVHGIDLDSFDLSDLGNEMTDAAIPGVGTAIMVVRSSLREFKLVEAHGDQKRAIKNIATDAAIVGTGVTGGGALGTLVGVLIDVGSGGATAGLGTTVIGPALGAFAGGLFSRKKAADVRTKPLRKARRAASTALERYNETVSAELQAAEAAWAAEQSESAARLERLGSQLKEGVQNVHARAENDLRRALAELDRQSVSLMAEALGDRISLWPWIANRRHRQWRDFAESQTTTLGRLDALLAHRHHSKQTGEVIEGFAASRLRTLAASIEAMAGLTLEAGLGRRMEHSALAVRFGGLQHRVRSNVFGDLKKLWKAGELVRSEIVATGTQPQAWVDENLPPQPRPVEPELVTN